MTSMVSPTTVSSNESTASLCISPCRDDGFNDSGGEEVTKQPSSESGSDEFVSVTVQNVLEILLEEMQQKNGSGAGVTEALTSLFRLIHNDDCKKSQENKNKATRLSAYKTVISAMNTFPNSKEVQSKGCHCLQAFVYTKPGMIGSPLECDILDAGGMEASASALQKFPECDSVQKRGIGALANMLQTSHVCVPPCPGVLPKFGSSTCSEKALAAAARFVHDLNGVSLVLQAMKRFPREAGLQLAGSIFLGNLAAQDQFRATLQKWGAASLVGAAFDNHPEDEKLVASVKDFFRQL